MVQVLQDRSKPKFSEQIASGITAAMPGIQQYLEDNRNAKMQQQAAQKMKELTGVDFSGLPEDLQKIYFSELMKGQNKQNELTAKNENRKKLIDQIQGPKGFGDQINSVTPTEIEEGMENPAQGQKGPEDFFNEAEMYAAAGEHDLSRVSSEKARAAAREKTENTKNVSLSFKENKDFINKTHDQYEDSLRRESILERMNQLEETGELSDSGIINFLETIGMSPEWLKNPSNEEYNKLGLDLLGGGTLQADYGSRVLASEFKVSQQRIPTLSQTPEGRRQISENIRTMLLPAKLKNERMKFYIDRSNRTGQTLPHDLRGQVLKDIKPELEEAYDKFKQRNGRYKVKEGTIPDQDSIDKYFYISDGKEDKAIKMMEEDGYAIY